MKRLIPLALFVTAMASATEFAVTFSTERSDHALDGRLLILLSTDPADEPRNQINDSPRTQIVFGMDVDGWKPGSSVKVAESATGYPVRKLSELKPGEYTVQALLNRYETFHLADGRVVKLPPDRGEGQQWNSKPGNFYSKPVKVTIQAGDKPIALTLDQEIPPIAPLQDTKYIKHVKMQSKLLSAFWGRPMYLGAVVLLPDGFDEHPDARYPVLYFLQRLRDEAHRLAVPEHAEHFQFAIAQRGQRRGKLLAAAMDELGHHGAGHLWTQEQIAVEHFSDGGFDRFGRLVLHDVAHGAGPQGALRV